MRRTAIWLGALALCIGVIGCTPEKTGPATNVGQDGSKAPATENGQAALSPQAFAIRGVIEGFYGKPWTDAQRVKMFTFMAKQRFNTYVYAPKDDPYQRLQWADLYPEQEAKEMQGLIQTAETQGIRFVYSISPGTPIPLSTKPVTAEIEQKSITFSLKADREKLMAKLTQLREMGVHTFMLSFDDVKEELKDKDRGIYGTDYAQAHIELANAVLSEGKAADPKFELWFAPTRYHGVKDNAYWQTLRGKLDPSVQVIWTGPSILSKSITSEQADQVAKLLGRKPLIWDNYPVNDYTYEIKKRPQLLMGPIEGRDDDLGQHTAGLLANPMIQPETSKMALFTIGQYLQSPMTYDVKAAWEDALKQSIEGTDGSEAFSRFATYSRSSMLREENLEFQTMADAYWNQYYAPKVSNGTVNEEAMNTLRREFEMVRDLSKSLKSLNNQELWQEIEPWAQKLAQEGEAALLAVEMLSLDHTDPKRQELRKRVGASLRELDQNPLLIGEEIVQFTKTAFEKN